jgi:site-specific DNA-cytosine methylase
MIQMGNIYNDEEDPEAGRVYSPDGIAPRVRAGSGGGGSRGSLVAWQNSRDGIVGKEESPSLRSSGGTDIRKRPAIISGEVASVERAVLKYQGRNQRNIEGDWSFTVDGANTGGLKVGTRIRRLTPVECERLQGFPDGWTAGVSDTQRYKLMGNAVTVNVVEAIGRAILNGTARE